MHSRVVGTPADCARTRASGKGGEAGFRGWGRPLPCHSELVYLLEVLQKVHLDERLGHPGTLGVFNQDRHKLVAAYLENALGVFPEVSVEVPEELALDGAVEVHAAVGVVLVRLSVDDGR